MIYDFDELLGRGIIAARANNREEALKYLILAVKIQPRNTRVWLWLAASAESTKQQREVLERVLQIDPTLLPAKVLLDRLNGDTRSIQRSTDDFTIFTCPNCGGKQRFDPDLIGLVCNYCRHVEHLNPANAAQDESDLHTELIERSGTWAIGNSEFACSACGARLSIPSEQGTVTCPFCDSDQIAVQTTTLDLLQPTAILPFHISAEDVTHLLQKARLTPRPVAGPALEPVYLPFWTFDGRVHIRCMLEYRVPAEVFSENDRVFVEDNWPVNTNWYECKIDDLLIYAGRGRFSKAIIEILPFDLNAALEYRPEMLAGWRAELYQVALNDASTQAIQMMRSQAFRSAVKRRLFLREETMVEDDVRVLDQTYKLLLLPVWMIRMESRGKTIQVVVNGQTGKLSSKN